MTPQAHRHLRILQLAFALVLCGCTNAKYSFTMTQDGSSIDVSGGNENVHTGVAPPYLTVNFGFGDEYVAVAVHADRLPQGATVNFPCGFDDKGVEVTARFKGVVYTSQEKSSSGYVRIDSYAISPEPMITAVIEATLGDASTAVKVVGSAQIP